jgi:hypothetical protein
MIIYYIDGEKFTTDKTHEIPLSKISSPDENTPAWKNLSTGKNHEIPLKKISSPDENTPAWENLKTGEKLWCEKGYIFHRLDGPAFISSNGTKKFWLNDKRYDNSKEWLKAHPNQTNAFQVEMFLKYT